VTAVVFIILAVTVASRHGVTFGPGFGGYILGNILTLIAAAPLTYGVERAIEALPYPSNLLPRIGTPLAYIIALTVPALVLSIIGVGLHGAVVYQYRLRQATLSRGLAS
jgi:hypothetical protein